MPVLTQVGSDTGSGNDDPETKTFAVNGTARYVRVNFTSTDAPAGHIYKACISQVSITDQAPVMDTEPSFGSERVNDQTLHGESGHLTADTAGGDGR